MGIGINVYMIRSYQVLPEEIKHEYFGIKENNGEIRLLLHENDHIPRKISEFHEKLISMGLNNLETKFKHEK